MAGPGSGAADAIVVGGGFAGLASATALAESGCRVILLEGRPHLGGRARSWTDPDTGTVIDNGQHLFMGCYRETLRFLSRIGSLDGLMLQPRLEMALVEAGGETGLFQLPRLPSRLALLLGLLRFPGLDLSERIGLLRVARRIPRRARVLPTSGRDPLDQQTVASWLESARQSPEANRRLWHPLAIAALNEEPGAASAAMLVPVLREAFLTGADGSRFGLARVGLSDLYAQPAVRYLKRNGCEVRLRAPVRRLLVERGRCHGALLSDGQRLSAPAVVAAVPPGELLEMLPPAIAAEAFFAGAARIRSSPIVSVYLWFGIPVTDLPFASLVGGTWQWLFNRHALVGGGGTAHSVTLVRSAARDLVERPREALVHSAVKEMHQFFPVTRRAGVRHALVIKEKRATMAPVCGAMSLRPSWRTPYNGLHVAGDWTATGLPSTIEGAVLSGHACARQMLEDRGG